MSSPKAPDGLAAALKYAARGWPVFPLQPRGKLPAIPKAKGGSGFKDATTDPAVIRRWWTRWPEANVGIASGAVSGIVVLDVDGEEGEASLATLLNDNGSDETPTARTGGGGRHLLFAHPGRTIGCRTGMLPGLDLKGDGGYIVAPPSVHPNGTRYTWAVGFELERVQLAPLPGWLLELIEPKPRPATKRAASTSTWTPTRTPGEAAPWAEKALRDECEAVARSPAGHTGLAGAGRNSRLNVAAFNLGQIVGGGHLERARVEANLYAAAEACGLVTDDGEVRVRGTMNSGIEKGMQTPRGPKDEGRTPSLQLVDAGETPAKDEESSTRMFIVKGQSITLADEALDALATGPEPGVYVRARQLVRVVRDCGRIASGVRRPPGAPMIQLLSLDALRDRLARLGQWRSPKGREMMPPVYVVRSILARAQWPFPELEGVIEAPTMRLDGSILDRPGFDAETGLLYEPFGPFPAVPAHPTAAEVRNAVVALLDPLRDFPFREDSDRSAAVAAELSLVGRPAIDGCVPLFAVGGATPGIGKGLLVDEISTVGTGRPAARMTTDSDDSETRKRILAVALEGLPVVLLDNVEGRLGSKSLASALTAATWKDRLLGVNANAEAPLRAVWIATGNNVSFRGDLGRRVVPVGMSTNQEHPEDRPAESFKYPKLLEHVAGVRPQLVVAALTVLRGYHEAGRPEHGCPGRMGSFESWDELIRGACVWAGLADPIGGRERIRSEDDTDRVGLGVALQACVEAFGYCPFTASEAAQRAENSPALRDALLELVGRDKLDGRSVGYAFRNVRGRIVDGFKLDTAGKEHKTTRWHVIQVDGSSEEEKGP